MLLKAWNDMSTDEKLEHVKLMVGELRQQTDRKLMGLAKSLDEAVTKLDALEARLPSPPLEPFSTTYKSA